MQDGIGHLGTGRMDLYATIDGVARALSGDRIAFLAIPMTVILYLCGRKAEFSAEAIASTAATVAFSGFNIVAALLFRDPINQGAQAAYDALRIPHLPAGFWDGTPLIVASLIGLAAKDLADYVIHRLMHTPWLWPAHAAHHTDTYVNAFTSYRVHFLEGVLMSFTYILMLTWLQMPDAMPIVIVLSILHNMYVHMDLPFTHGPLKYLIASPVYHRWHHADVPEAYGKNLANIMPIYDVIFGTYYCPGPVNAPLGALKAGLEDRNPILIWIYPFQQWGRLIRRALGKAQGAPVARPGLPPAE
jgi:sterol desaturase/sphingolipid hydroxylase (fatty acid hydroxylase superfamily)